MYDLVPNNTGGPYKDYSAGHMGRLLRVPYGEVTPRAIWGGYSACHMGRLLRVPYGEVTPRAIWGGYSNEPYGEVT